MDESYNLTDYERALIRAEARWPRAKRLEHTGIPRRFWDKTWDDYEKLPETARMRAALIAYTDGFMDSDPRMHGGRGFLLQGVPGLGKTLAAAIVGVTLSDQGFLVRFTTMAGYMDLVTRQFTLQQSWAKYENIDAHEEWMTNDDALRVMRKTAHLLIIDDVGKEHHTASKFAVDSFDSLVRHRYDLGRPVAMTTNVAPDDWLFKYSEAMESFIKESCYVYEAENTDGD
jgi:DNA replication protein DnaC